MAAAPSSSAIYRTYSIGKINPKSRKWKYVDVQDLFIERQPIINRAMIPKDQLTEDYDPTNPNNKIVALSSSDPQQQHLVLLNASEFYPGDHIVVPQLFEIKRYFEVPQENLEQNIKQQTEAEENRDMIFLGCVSENEIGSTRRMLELSEEADLVHQVIDPNYTPSEETLSSRLNKPPHQYQEFYKVPQKRCRRFNCSICYEGDFEKLKKYKRVFIGPPLSKTIKEAKLRKLRYAKEMIQMIDWLDMVDSLDYDEI